MCSSLCGHTRRLRRLLAPGPGSPAPDSHGRWMLAGVALAEQNRLAPVVAGSRPKSGMAANPFDLRDCRPGADLHALDPQPRLDVLARAAQSKNLAAGDVCLSGCFRPAAGICLSRVFLRSLSSAVWPWRSDD